MYKKSAKKISNKATLVDSKPSVVASRPTTSKQNYIHQSTFSIQQGKTTTSQPKKQGTSGQATVVAVRRKASQSSTLQTEMA